VNGDLTPRQCIQIEFPDFVCECPSTIPSKDPHLIVMADGGVPVHGIWDFSIYFKLSTVGQGFLNPRRVFGIAAFLNPRRVFGIAATGGNVVDVSVGKKILPTAASIAAKEHQLIVQVAACAS
jgi:hypothetical protein